MNGKDEDNVLSAKEAAFLTDKAIINNEKIEFNNIMKTIKKQSEKGYNSMLLDCISPSNKKQLIDWCGGDEEIRLYVCRI